MSTWKDTDEYEDIDDSDETLKVEQVKEGGA